MKLIDISTPKHPELFVMVDDEDYEYLNQWKWSPSRMESPYAIRWRPGGAGILMHREILKTDKHVDHIDGNKMNNQRSNLRAATNAENQRNRPKKRNNTSGLIGVSWNREKRLWNAKLGFNGKTVLNKYGRDPLALAAIRDEAAMVYHGEFAVLNFPQQDKG